MASHARKARHIVAIGGGVLVPETGNFRLERYIVELTGKRRPKICYLPTASGDEPNNIQRFYQSYARFTPQLSHLRFFARTPRDLEGLLGEQDVIHVGGGNTKSMLAVWREYGVDGALRQALERGVILCGSSAGSICWFEEGVTDSFAGPLMRLACLGFLPGSNCPHYDGEKDRRPAYQRMVGTRKIAAGYAADDGAGLHFIDGRLHRAISSRPKAKAYRLELRGRTVRETVVPTRYLRD